MKTLLEIRDHVSSIVDLDFVIDIGNTEVEYDDEHIAKSIRGSNYKKTRERIDAFVERCNQTLNGLEERVNQTESEYQALAAQAHAQQPGNPPSDFWVDNKNPNSVARYNEKVDRYNNQLELYRRLTDKANRAKERYEDALEKYNDKKADLENQVNQKHDELEPAMEQDIVVFLDKMLQLTSNHIHEQSRPFEGFMFVFTAKRVYSFLSDRVNTSGERRSASDLIKKLDEGFENISSDEKNEIKENLVKLAGYFHQCFSENESIFREIKNDLGTLPYAQCKENEEAIKTLISLPIETQFDYQHIVDPEQLTQIEQQVRERKSQFENDIKRIEDCSMNMKPAFDKIMQVKDACEKKLTTMEENRKNKLGTLISDIPFVLSILDEAQQDEHLKRHKKWLKEIVPGIEKKLGIEFVPFVEKAVSTDLLINSAKEVLSADEGLNFLPYRDKLDEKKQQFIEAVGVLDGHLEDINRLPQEKAGEVKKKISSWLNISILPLGNLGVLFPIHNSIKTFLPALSSTNSFYAALRETLIKKFQVFLIVHIALLLACAAASFVVVGEFMPLFYGLAAVYSISTLFLLFKSSQLKECIKSQSVQSTGQLQELKES